MAEKRTPRRPRLTEDRPPIPLEPVDLLAGIAPGVELCADDSIASDEPDDATVSVAEVGRMLRSGDATLRRLIRSPGIRPSPPRPDAPPRDPMRAGVPPRTPEKPGE